MLNPLISIIVPVYNVEKYLRPCLDSILSQTYTNWEAILVDDGSKDNSGMICDEYAQKDSRFIVVHKENAGVAQARITGFENSKGELITFVDADDYVASEYIEKLSAPIITYNVDMSACNHYDVHDTKMVSRPMLIGLFDNPKDFIVNHYMYDTSLKKQGMSRMLWAKMYRRKYVESGLQKGLGLWFGEDQVMVFDILYNITSFVQIPEPMYYYIQRDGQATKKYDLSLWDSIIAMIERYIDIDKEKIAKKMLWRLAWLYIKDITHNKMISANLPYKIYCQHLGHMRENECIDFFFNSKPIKLNASTFVSFWLLKYRLFSLFYFFVNIRHFMSRLKRRKKLLS